MERPSQYEDSWLMVPLYDGMRGRIWPFETKEQALAAAEVADRTQGYINVTAAYVFPPVGVEAEPVIIDF
jgi:hypothetical protein